MADGYARYSGFSSGGTGGGVQIFPNFGAFPPIGTFPNGTLLKDAGTHILYEYNSTTLAYEPIASNPAYLAALASSGSPTTVGTFDTATPSADGAVIASGQLFMQSASVTVPGLVNNTTQSFSGAKTFTGTITASNFTGASSGSNTGDVTLTPVGAIPNANGASLSGQVLTLQPANATFPGLLTAVAQTFGGPKTMTDDIHLGFSDYAAIASPAAPPAGFRRLYTMSIGGGNVFATKGATGEELIVLQDNVVTVFNGSGGTLTKGQAVYINGASGGFPSVGLAVASNSSSALVYGLVQSPSILSGALGQVMVAGVLINDNTSAFAAGDILYLSPTTPGALTATAPTAPQLIVEVGVVTVSSATVGKIALQIVNAVAVPIASTAIPFYFAPAASPDVATYSQVLTAPPLGVETLFSGTGVGGNVKTFIKAFVTNVGTPSTTFFPSGTWYFQLYANTSTATGSNLIYVDVFKRSSGGVETLLFGAVTPELIGAITQYTIASAQPSFTTLTTDRIVLKVFYSTSVAAHTMTLYTAGSIHSSVLVSTLVTSIGAELQINKNTPNGYAGLDGTGKLFLSQFPTVDVPHGGTGDTTFVPYEIITGGTTATGPLQQVASLGTSGQVLTSAGAGALPTWTTPTTNAATVTTTATATNASFFIPFAPLSTTSNQALGVDSGLSYNPSTDTLSTTTFAGALTGNASTATTAGNVTGIVALANGGTGQTTAAASFNALNPMTTTGDMIYEASAGVAARLPIGTTNQFLSVVGGIPTWQAGTGGAVFPTIQKFLSSSGTYTTPANVVWIEVEMSGPGGGSSGSGSGGAGNGGAAGGSTTFGANTCTSGAGGIAQGAGGTGGTTILGVGTGINLTGGNGGASMNQTVTANSMGGTGGNNPFGGAGGAGGTSSNQGTAGIANTGGGGGAPGTGTVNVVTGSGGGAGGYIHAIIIPTALQTFAYSIGNGGAAGTAGTSGLAGNAGGSGIIVVTEYYANGAIGTATNVTGIVAQANGGTGFAGGPVSVMANSPTNTITGAFADATGWTETEDTNAAFTPTTGVFLPPHNALYGFEVYLYTAYVAAAVNATTQIAINLNGANVKIGALIKAASLNQSQTHLVGTIRLVTTDTVKFQMFDSSTTPTYSGAAPYNYMSIWEIR